MFSDIEMEFKITVTAHVLRMLYKIPHQDPIFGLVPQVQMLETGGMSTEILNWCS